MADAVKEVLADQKRDSTPTALVPGVSTREIQVPGAVGSMPPTVYTPEGTGSFPVVLYFHGEAGSSLSARSMTAAPQADWSPCSDVVADPTYRNLIWVIGRDGSLFVAEDLKILVKLGHPSMTGLQPQGSRARCGDAVKGSRLLGGLQTPSGRSRHSFLTTGFIKKTHRL